MEVHTEHAMQQNSLEDLASQLMAHIESSGQESLAKEAPVAQVVSTTEESLEGLAAQLFKQIRNSDFLEKNKPEGESLFVIAEQQEEERKKTQTGAKTSNGLFQRISHASQSSPAPKPVPDPILNHGNIAGNPSLQDALGAILQDLDESATLTVDSAARASQRVSVVSGPALAQEGQESLEGLVGHLFQQIRAGALENCEPEGESLFAIAAQQEEKKKQAAAKPKNGLFSRIATASQERPPHVQATAAASSSARGGRPTFQDALATVLQDLDESAASRGRTQQAIFHGAAGTTASQGSGGGQGSLEDLFGTLFHQFRDGGLDGCQPQVESASAEAAQEPRADGQALAGAMQSGIGTAGKPTFQDALDTILQDLDSSAACHGGAARGGGAEDGSELVEAFQAMAPTLEALMKDLAGNLEDEKEA